MEEEPMEKKSKKKKPRTNIRSCRFDAKNNRITIFTSSGKIRIDNPDGFSDEYLKVEVAPHKNQSHRFIYYNTSDNENKDTAAQ
jgi:hypothetical protein